VVLYRDDVRRIARMLSAYEAGDLSRGSPNDDEDVADDVVAVCLAPPDRVARSFESPRFASGKFLALQPTSKQGTIVWVSDSETSEPTFRLQLGLETTDPIPSDSLAADVQVLLRDLPDCPDGLTVMGPGSQIAGEDWPSRIFLVTGDVQFVTENEDDPAAGGSRTLRYRPTRSVFPVVEFWSQADPWVAGRLGLFRQIPGYGSICLDRETWGAL
jgi:hypothetical protein